MQLLSSILKEFLYFLIFWEMELLAQARNNKKKSYPEKIFYTSGKWNFLTLILKKISYIFSRESFYHISENINPEKNHDISGKGDPRKFLIFQEVAFLARKMKKPTLKKLLIFQGGG